MRRPDISLETRKRVICLHGQQGKSYKEIAGLLELKRPSVVSTIQRWKNTGEYINGERTGRPSKLSVGLRRIIKRAVDNDPTMSSSQICEMLEEHHQVSFNRHTVRRALYKFGYGSYTRRKKPHISKKNRKKRLEFAREHVNKPQEFWDKFVFTDESKFNIFGNDGRIRVWRNPKDGLNPKYTQKTVKHNGGGVMVWGCMAANGVGKLAFVDGIMDQYVYIKILEENLKPSTDQLGLTGDFTFQQDNDPKHTAGNALMYIA